MNPAISKLPERLRSAGDRAAAATRKAVGRVLLPTGLRRIGNNALEYILRLQIRVKLSLIVAAAVIGTTFVISSIAMRLQERELRLQTTVLGVQIVQSLSAVAEDNLLLNSVAVLQDYVKNFGKRGIRGLEHLYVIDRAGTIVAHIQADSVNRTVAAADFDLLASTDSVRALETANEFRFINGIYVTKHEGSKTRRIMLGGASAAFSKAVLLAPIEELRNTIILASFAVSVLAIGLMYGFSKRIVSVIIVLSDAARKVGSGDLKVAVVTRMKDEIGMLAREFNMMVLQIREKTEMQKFVSRSTKEMIARGEEAVLGGSRKSIAALFTDIRNFTAYSEQHWPEEVVETLNHYLDLQTRIIHQHDGVVDKFIGDGIMSVFTGPQMAVNAVEAAIHIQHDLKDLNNGRAAEQQPVLEVGIGIALGPAVMGSIGSKERMDHTAIGDTVNLASRLCNIARGSEILVSDDMIKRLRDAYPSRSQGTIAIKGKQHEVPVFKIPFLPAA